MINHPKIKCTDPTTCKHEHMRFIAASTWSIELKKGFHDKENKWVQPEFESGRYRVSICRDCGQIHVTTMVDGKWCRFNFGFMSEIDLACAKKYVDFMNEE